jgi:isopentenyl-diphosphate delta-isomerase
LHRAFSIFILNKKGQILLQQRALNKYHSAGLWTNACCSHPRPGEDTLAAAKRRLKEEMGLEVELTHKGKFVYKTVENEKGFENGLTEHELDHVYFGQSEKDPKINKEEANAFRWIKPEDLKKELKKSPWKFTFWFRIAFNLYFLKED